MLDDPGALPQTANLRSRRDTPMDAMLILFAVLAGAALPVQAAVNATLARYGATPVWAAAISACLSTITLVVIALGPMRLPLPRLAALAGGPMWMWLGGLLGCIVLLGMMTVAPRLGVATMIASVVAGQMVGALLLDHFGWLGLPQQPISVGRLAGAAAVCAGVALVRIF